MAALNSIGKVYQDLGDQAKSMHYYELALQQEWGKPTAPAWSDKASLSYVAVGGNASSQTTGFANEYTYSWSAASALTFKASAVRVATRLATYSATGSSPANFVLSNTAADQVTVADYTASARFAQNLTDRTLWFAGGGWERNIPAGIDNRAMECAGVGYWWTRTDRRTFQTDLGLGYTKAIPVVEAPGFPVSYATINAIVTYEQNMGLPANHVSRG